MGTFQKSANQGAEKVYNKLKLQFLFTKDQAA